MRRALSALLDEVAGLNEHAARPARGIEDDAVVRLDDVDEDLHERGRGEELAVVLRALHGELHQEVFVDAPEDVATGGAKRLAVEDAEQIFEKSVLEFRIIFGKLIEQRLEVALDSVHRLHERRAEVRALGQRQQGVVTGFLRQHERATFFEIGGGQRALGHFPCGLVRLDFAQSGVVSVRRVAQEDDAQHRHTIFAGGQLGIGAEIVGGIPEIGFQMLNIGEVRHGVVRR